MPTQCSKPLTMMHSSIRNCRMSTAISYTVFTLGITKSMRHLRAYTLQNMQNSCENTLKKHMPIYKYY